MTEWASAPQAGSPGSILCGALIVIAIILLLRRLK